MKTKYEQKNIMYVNAVKITTIVDIDFFCQSLQFSVSSAQTPVIIIETFCEMNLIFRADNRITASPVVLRSSPSSPHFFARYLQRKLEICIPRDPTRFLATRV